jgi:hypothetical protein
MKVRAFMFATFLVRVFARFPALRQINCSRFTLSFAVVPTLLLLVAVLGWSLFWWAMAGQGMAAFDAWLERQARMGRLYSCADRAVGGFPFRLEIRCSALTATITDQRDTKIDLSLSSALFVMQIFDSRHVIMEAQGPLVRKGDTEHSQWEARWSKAQASFVWGTKEGYILDHRPERMAVVVHDLIVHRLEKAAPDIAATEAQLHIQPVVSDPNALVAALTFDQAFFGTSQTGINVVFGAEMRHFPGLYPRALSSWLRDFEGKAGEITITQARFSSALIDLHLRGTVGLDVEGRPKGTFSLNGRGIEQLPRLMPAGVLPDAEGQAIIGARLAVAANRLAIVVADGRLFVAGVPVLDISPLY